MKYCVNINKKIIQSLLNNNVEINVMLYHIVLKLKLAVQLNVTVTMKDAENVKSSFIEYIFDIAVRIEDVIIKQSFFIFEKNLNTCILDQFFEMIIHMIRQTLNDELICVTVFDSENNLIQTIFQVYALNDVDDCYKYQIIKINII